MTEKKIRMEYTVKIIFEGYGDKTHPNRFQEVADECVRTLHSDVTSCHVDKGSATVAIKKPSKILHRDVLP
jgi:hypothetical protein